MAIRALNESEVELATLDWFQQLGYGLRYGPEIAPREPGGERESFSDVVIVCAWITSMIDSINPDEQCRPFLIPSTFFGLNHVTLRHRRATTGTVLWQRSRIVHQPKHGT